MTAKKKNTDHDSKHSLPSIANIINTPPEKEPLSDIAISYYNKLQSYINSNNIPFSEIEPIIKQILQYSDDTELIDLAIKAYCKEYIKEGINPIHKVLLLILENMPEHIFLQALNYAKQNYNIQTHPSYAFILESYRNKYDKKIRLPKKEQSNKEKEITL